MVSRSIVRVSLERGKEFPHTWSLPLPLAGEGVRDLAGQRDVTMTVEVSAVGGRLLIAIDGSLAFIGQECPEGIFQLVRRPSVQQNAHEFIIGDQPTQIEARYLLDLNAAALTVQEWLEGERTVSRGMGAPVVRAASADAEGAPITGTKRRIATERSATPPGMPSIMSRVGGS